MQEKNTNCVNGRCEMYNNIQHHREHQKARTFQAKRKITSFCLVGGKLKELC